MTKILFLVLHRKDRSPGQRYRHEQYISHLEKNGFLCDFSPLLSKKDDELFYKSGNVFSKVIIGVKSIFRRLKDVFRANQYDYIYIYRDAFFFGTFFEKLLSKKKPQLVFDFDDSIWLMDENPNQGIFNRLKNPEKTAKIISLSDKVIVGNKYLKEYASNFNSNVSIIPSTINFQDYGNLNTTSKSSICIGWTGSFSTIKHFETVIPALKKIKARYDGKVYFKLIGDSSYMNDELELVGSKWNSITEAQDLSELDIGLMPLPDDQWSKGKCAMKGLQYMALEIPTIMSPVGVNSDIIQDGENGFLASQTEEWVEKISLLVENDKVRDQVGKAGRKTVEQHFSVQVNKEKWLEVFKF